MVESEHLFLRNIYSHSQIKTVSIDENALQDSNATEEVMDFIREDLCGAYDTFSSLRQDIEKNFTSKKTIFEKARTVP